MLDEARPATFAAGADAKAIADACRRRARAPCCRRRKASSSASASRSPVCATPDRARSSDPGQFPALARDALVDAVARAFERPRPDRQRLARASARREVVRSRTQVVVVRLDPDRPRHRRRLVIGGVVVRGATRRSGRSGTHDGRPRRREVPVRAARLLGDDRHASMAARARPQRRLKGASRLDAREARRRSRTTDDDATASSRATPTTSRSGSPTSPQLLSARGCSSSTATRSAAARRSGRSSRTRDAERVSSAHVREPSQVVLSELDQRATLLGAAGWCCPRPSTQPPDRRPRRVPAATGIM